MKKIFTIIFAMISSMSFVLPAYALEASELDRLQQMFAIDDAFSRQVAIQSLQNQVAAADRADALVALWDGASSSQRAQVRRNLLVYVMQEQDVDLFQHAATKQRIANVKNSSNADLRRVALNLHASKNDLQGIQVYLEDEDSELRQHAISLLAKKPATKEILLQYINKYKNNKSRQKSVEKAEFILKHNTVTSKEK